MADTTKPKQRFHPGDNVRLVTDGVFGEYVVKDVKREGSWWTYQLQTPEADATARSLYGGGIYVMEYKLSYAAMPETKTAAPQQALP